MSALTSLFSSMANKIRSKVGGSDTYTPTQMVSAIDDVYDAGIADATTNITPSDASPVAMLANLGYKPTTAGYAIESNPTTLNPSNTTPATITSGMIYKASEDGKAVASVKNVTPSSTPRPVSADDIVHIGGSGEIVDDISIVNPNNVLPTAVVAGNNYRITYNDGYIIRSYDNKTPDDTTPPSVAIGDIVKIRTNGGYLIASQPSNKTPDDTTPPTVLSGEIVKMGGAGYLYATQQTGYDYKTTKTISVSSKSASLTGLTSGKEYYMFVSYAWTNTNYNAEISSMTNTTNLTKVDSGRDRPTSSLAAYENWSLYTFKATSTSSTITFSTTATSAFTARVLLFEK